MESAGAYFVGLSGRDRDDARAGADARVTPKDGYSPKSSAVFWCILKDHIVFAMDYMSKLWSLAVFVMDYRLMWLYSINNCPIIHLNAPVLHLKSKHNP